MAFKNLTNDEMVEISDAWTNTKKEARQAINQVPRLKGLLSEVRRAHRALLAVNTMLGGADYSDLSAKLAELDREHDALIGGIYNYLTSLIELTPDGAAFQELRDGLFPDGVGPVVQATYRGQAGFSRVLAEKLTEERRKQLDAIPLPNGSLLNRLERVIEVAQELGDLEESRTRLKAEEARATPTQNLQARNSWVRMANAFVAVAELEELPGAFHDQIFASLRQAERVADARSARRTGRSASEMAERRVPAVSDVAPAPGAAPRQSVEDSGTTRTG